MDIALILQSKPILIGVHLSFAIIGIDAFLWLFGQLKGHGGSQKSMIVTAAVGVFSFIISWVAGGYYYVAYYGALVKPLIKSSAAPWAHNIAMETKEHIFLFVIPLAMTIFFITLLKKEDMERFKLRRPALLLCAAIVLLGFLIGAMGFIISSVARWGAIFT